MANGMGCETAVQRGVGKVLLDVRRGDGPPEARHFTFAALALTEELIARDPKCVSLPPSGPSSTLSKFSGQIQLGPLKWENVDFPRML